MEESASCVLPDAFREELCAMTWGEEMVGRGGMLEVRHTPRGGRVAAIQQVFTEQCRRVGQRNTILIAVCDFENAFFEATLNRPPCAGATTAE